MTKGISALFLLLCLAGALPAQDVLSIPNLKMLWTSNAKRDHPTWFTLLLTTDGTAVTGTATEVSPILGVNLDPDGDPLGYNTNTFSSADATMTDAHFNERYVEFTIHYGGGVSTSNEGITFEGKRLTSDPQHWVFVAAGLVDGNAWSGSSRFSLTQIISGNLVTMISDYNR
jgi:hypothetical protein